MLENLSQTREKREWQCGAVQLVISAHYGWEGGGGSRAPVGGNMPQGADPHPPFLYARDGIL